MGNGALFRCLHAFCVTPCAGTTVFSIIAVEVTVQERRVLLPREATGQRGRRCWDVLCPFCSRFSLGVLGLRGNCQHSSGPSGRAGRVRVAPAPAGCCLTDVLQSGVCFRVTDFSLSYIVNLLRWQERKGRGWALLSWRVTGLILELLERLRGPGCHHLRPGVSARRAVQPGCPRLPRPWFSVCGARQSAWGSKGRWALTATCPRARGTARGPPPGLPGAERGPNQNLALGPKESGVRNSGRSFRQKKKKKQV